MAEIWLRAYGGTGNLIARAFVALMMTAPLVDCNHKFKIYAMDYDDEVKKDNDNDRLTRIVELYGKLHRMGIPGIAENEIELVPGLLKEVRLKTYNLEDKPTFSFKLSELFGGNRIDILESCLTRKQILAANEKGNFGDLARNSMIAKPMEVQGNFNPTYEGFSPDNTIIFYLGSTDGGVGNTVLDRDLYAMINYISNKGFPVDHTRQYKIYSVRTLPYKKHSTTSNEPEDEEIAERILNQMVAQSRGVIDNILSKSDYVYVGGQDDKKKYLLDALFLAGYKVTSSASFDDSNDYKSPGADDGVEQAHIKCQSHKTHATEIVAALMIIDTLNIGVSSAATIKNIFAYNANVSPAHPNYMDSDDLFTNTELPFSSPFDDDPIKLTIAQRVKRIVLVYAFLKRFKQDIQKGSRHDDRDFKKLIKKAYNVSIVGDGQFDDPQCEKVSALFEDFQCAIEELIRVIWEMQDTTKFGGACKIQILPHQQLEALNQKQPGEFSLRGIWEPNQTEDDEYFGVIDELIRNKCLKSIAYNEETHAKNSDDKVAAEWIRQIYVAIHQLLDTI